MRGTTSCVRKGRGRNDAALTLPKATKWPARRCNTSLLILPWTAWSKGVRYLPYPRNFLSTPHLLEARLHALTTRLDLPGAQIPYALMTRHHPVTVLRYPPS